jgi:ELWxxDGT repeat protein
MNRTTSCLSTAILLTGAALPAQSCPLVLDINTGNSGKDGSWPANLTCSFGNRLYFSAGTAPSGVELYMWNATSGVALLKDIFAGTRGVEVVLGTGKPQ